MTAREITDTICRCHWSTAQKILIPNVNEWWEADLLCIHASDWVDEVEIKISKSDFKREFLKKERKHRILLEGHPKWLGWNRDDWTETTPHIIRRYWMAMPVEVAESVQDLVPEYAGLMAITQGKYGRKCKVIRHPKLLKNARKITAAERHKLLWKCHARYWHMRFSVGGQLIL